jgi:endonuclease G
VTVRVGDAQVGGDPAPARAITSAGAVLPAVGAEDDEVVVAEGRAADYADREGYAEGFLGPEVPLPTVLDEADVLTFPGGAGTARVLRYEHFSVSMSRSRRLCHYSAVNVDGSLARRMKRADWRTDPRIPASAQIARGCYGAEPKFSRGHMTRREDPIWGDEPSAQRARGDSMHVTNAVPQVQPFNAGIWLGLEDYALENARQDRMRISVFTGPFLDPRDPIRHGVQIPREFWKVIAFVHDETGELCATGYTMSQEAFLREEEFVFGRHETYQASIAAIGERAGLSFGELARRDPFQQLEEAVARPLRSFREVRFT